MSCEHIIALVRCRFETPDLNRGVAQSFDGRRSLKLCLMALAVALFSGMPAAQAQSQVNAWPTKTVRWIVPYGPGGPTDTVSRLVAQKLSERVHQPVIVENRPGAAGNVGTSFVANAPPDGHTLLYVVPAIVLNPYFLAGSPNRSVVTPVTRIIQYPMVLLASNNFKPRTVEEIAAAARAKPGSVSCASTGGIPTVACEMLKSSAKAELLIVPYKGQAQATIALMAGDIDLMFDGVVSAVAAVKGGRMRPIAALDSSGKNTALGSLPAVSETFPGFEFTTWHGLMAPAGTPREIVARINREVAAVLSSPDVKQRLNELGFEAVGDSPDDFEQFLRAETVKFDRVINQAGIKPQ
jgi:tripartite-type tricarboxylate transporter receptor subunit TctC